MSVPSEPLFARDLEIRADHGQIYVYSAAARDRDDRAEPPVELRALDDAVSSRRFVGVADALLDILTPGQRNWHTPMRVEVWSAEPDPDREPWDHEVDADLDVPDGRLVFEASGGGGQVTLDLPSGRYRARISGRGFTVLGAAGADGDDCYRLQLWPRTAASEPVLRRSWPGWRDYR